MSAPLSQRLYAHAPIAVQNALISAYAWRRRRKRVGGRYPEMVREAAAVWSADNATTARRQIESLRQMLGHAVEHVPYYRRVLGPRLTDGIGSIDDLSRLPILTKETVRTHAAELVADGAEAFWTNETSGSTGTPLTVKLSADAYRLTMALLAWHEQDHGIPAGARYATFAGRLVQPVTDDRPPFWRLNWAEQQLLCSAYHLSEKNLPGYIEALERFAPAEIIGYPSAIATFASLCARTGRRPSLPLRAVITNSETLLAWQRDVIEATLGAPVFDYYGTAEAVVFAGQCAAGRYHPHPLMGIAEVVDDAGVPVGPGGTGRLIATTLCNRTMPLIRYEVGDVVVQSEGACVCGRPGETWREVIGRVDDVVVTPDGHHVGRLDHIFKGVTSVREAQIAHVAPAVLEIRVVPGGGYGEDVAALLVDNARSRLGDAMTIRVVTIAAVPRTSRGKFRSVVKEFAS